MTFHNKDEPMTRVVLNRPHTHAGKLHGVRERIEVDASTADWLIRQGIAALETSPPPAHNPEPKTSQRKDLKP